ncbi:MAG TPA: ribose-phosphate diphosphokinase [Candidatus Saccharimonadales bacterium]|nr:ribose-phosphate diphosphokinase [Candidatus Saccharimonadales bacterium]
MGSSVFLDDGNLSQLRVAFSRFPDGEIHCVLKEAERCRSRDVMIFHRLYPKQNEHLVELIFLLDVIRRTRPKSISVFVPYLPYSRQDKSGFPGEASGAQIICKLLAGAGCSDLYTLDCHFMRGEKVIKVDGLKVHNISVLDGLIDKYRKLSAAEFDIIGPDNGSEYITKKFAGQSLYKERGEYSRHPKNRNKIRRTIISVSGDHIRASKKVLLVDDMVSTGTTLLKAIEVLKTKGVKNFSCAFTHGLFTEGSLPKLAAQTDHLLYTDTARRKGASIKVKDVFESEVLNPWQKSRRFNS